MKCTTDPSAVFGSHASLASALDLVSEFTSSTQYPYGSGKASGVAYDPTGFSSSGLMVVSPHGRFRWVSYMHQSG